MKLIIGLGNSSPHFNGTRHNVGFTMVDTLAAEHGFLWQPKDRFKAQIAEGQIADQKIVLAKPTTFYNLSGESARAIKDFYKISSMDTLVIHDELALPFGTIRARLGGSDAGNNGIKSLIVHIGDDFARIRVGVANDHTPTNDASDFVLGHFTHQEMQHMPKVLQAATHLVHHFIANQKLEHTSVRVGE